MCTSSRFSTSHASYTVIYEQPVSLMLTESVVENIKLSFLYGKTDYRSEQGGKATINSRHNYLVAENVLCQSVMIDRPNQTWVTDITYIPTYGFIQSMSRKRNCYDNPCMESFFHTLKTELVYLTRYRTRAAATRRSLFQYIECYYNRIRLHSALGYKSPCEYKKRALAA